MKKLFLTVAFILTAGLIFSSESPSLDGRAVVADDGVFPKGLFAKTVGYLPGDSINVTNPSNGSQVDILVIGSLDPSEGVAVLLSPEAAGLLNIKKNSNNMVKLTKRSGSSDEVVNGTAVITKYATPVPPETVGEKVDESPSESVDEKIDEVPSEIVDEKVDEVPAVADPAEENLLEKNIGPAVEESPAERIYADDVLQNETEEEGVTTNYSEYTPIMADDIPDEKVEEPAEDAIADAPDEMAGETVEDEQAEAPEEIAEELVPADDIPDEKVEEPAEDAIADAPDEMAGETVEDEPAEAPEEIAEEPVPADDIPEDKIEEPVLCGPEEKDSEDEYDAIVLVPSDANPPVSASTSADGTTALSDQPVRIEPDEVEEVVVPAEVVEKPSAVISGVNYISAGDELDSGKYYVQIAVYSKAENVGQISTLYASRYPLTVIDSGGKKTVLVGPLSVDEYGIILERFKSYGFKDAFVKFVKNGNGERPSAKAASSSNER